MQHRHHISNGRPRQRRNDTDSSRKHRQGPFSIQIEKPLRSQASLELFKRHLLRAAPLRFDILKNDLILPARFIYGDSTPRNDMQPILQTEPQSKCGRPENDGSHLAGIVFERTVEMPGPGRAKIGNFSLEPYL